jgi:hypothetical protein
MLQRQNQPQYGAGDRPTCPDCGGPMSLIRRTPHSEHGDSYERQTFVCLECRHEAERSADVRGNPHV